VNLSLVLEMAASGLEDRVAVTTAARELTYAELHTLANAAAARFAALDATAVLYLGTNHAVFPVALFGAAAAGVPFVPLNYRLGAGQLDAMVGAHPGAVLVCETAGDRTWPSLAACLDRDRFLADLAASPAGGEVDGTLVDPDEPAVLLYTSGTTAAPKAAILRHRNLTAYLFGTVEFGSAEQEEAVLVSVPPYHVAGLANLLSNVYAGRRVVYLENFDAEAWLDTVRAEGVTNAMVVPAMLARIVDALAGASDAGTPTLRSLSYGGARMPLTVLERALDLFPGVGMVNAYGLTETSSTIALLGPDDHRAAMASDDPAVRARLGSVGQLLPGIEIEIRDEDGTILDRGAVGLIHVRGEQISGEYAGKGGSDDGWFSTRDRGWLDPDGYLFIEGRADDTIIRGGENIAPAEIEDVIARLAGVADVAVVGVPDEQWGQRLAAVVVRSAGAGVEVDADAVRSWTKEHLRSSKTPDEVVFVDELPRTDTGKLLRRNLVADLSPT
jgi:acyl-CoA synthetase (AMP-forming)/AMP-acid ligase II